MRAAVDTDKASSKRHWKRRSRTVRFEPRVREESVFLLAAVEELDLLITNKPDVETVQSAMEM